MHKHILYVCITHTDTYTVLWYIFCSTFMEMKTKAPKSALLYSERNIAEPKMCSTNNNWLKLKKKEKKGKIQSTCFWLKTFIALFLSFAFAYDYITSIKISHSVVWIRKKSHK